MDSSNQVGTGRCVLTVFEGAPGVALTIEQIQSRLGWSIGDTNKIRCAVHRLLARNDGVTRVRPGVYTYSRDASAQDATTSLGDFADAHDESPIEAPATISVREMVLLALQEESGAEMTVDNISAVIAHKDKHYVFQAATKLVASGCGVSSPRPGTFIYTLDDSRHRQFTVDGKSVPVAVSEPIKPRFDKAHAARMRERVLNVLRRHPGEALSVRILAREIGSGNVSSVHTAAWIITRENKHVVRIRPGVFVYEDPHASSPRSPRTLTDTGRLIHNAIFDVLRGSDDPVPPIDLLNAVCRVVGSTSIRHAISRRIHQLVERGKSVAFGPGYPSKRTYALPKSD